VNIGLEMHPYIAAVKMENPMSGMSSLTSTLVVTMDKLM
jgi:hypothetical protein